MQLVRIFEIYGLDAFMLLYSGRSMDSGLAVISIIGLYNFIPQHHGICNFIES